MPKNIVVCCDGTANEFSEHRTNVVKLFYTLVEDPARQIAYYHPGLGTMEAVGAVTSVARKVTKLLGKAVGYGLESDIRDAYVFLMNCFEPGDRVYLFGFSRGAYTARAVASLLHMYGLIPRGNDPLVLYAIRMLTAINKLDKGSNKKDEKPKLDQKSGDPKVDSIFTLAGAFKATFSHRECKPHFVGVWDTVSSVGWIENPLHLPYATDNPDIAIGRHAVSIDERRAFFRTNLWRLKNAPPQSGPKDLKQVWFAGVHSDVGGGYPEKDSGLAKIALQWMLKEAEAAGLLVDPARRDQVLGLTDPNYARPDPNAVIHESLTLWWWPVEFIFKRHWNWAKGQWERRANLGRHRTIPPGSLIHQSVYDRAGYKPVLPPDGIPVT
jgi:uncharacterized protein (DUF2235 family)